MRLELWQALERVARRFRGVRLWTALAICWLVWALVGTGVNSLLSRSGGATDPVPLVTWLGLVTAATGLACGAIALRSVRDHHWVARKIETRHPELAAVLLAATEEATKSPTGRLGFLQTAVIRDALRHGRLHNWNDAVPAWKLRGAQLAHFAAAGWLIVVMMALVEHARSTTTSRVEPIAEAPFDLKVEPGNTQIERGTSLLVVARFGGPVPAEASLVVEDATSASTSRGMTRNLQDPTFAARIPAVDADLKYRVHFGGRQSETYQVEVFEYPQLKRVDAELAYPEFTGLEPKVVQDVRHVTAVEGTKLTLLFHLNKRVAQASLVDEDHQPLALAPYNEAAHVYRASWTMSQSRRYRVQLVDQEGRPNKLPAEIVVKVTPNRPPVVAMAQPADDVRVSPIEELALAAKLEDDYGLLRYGVSFTPAAGEPREIVLNDRAAGGKKDEAKYLLDFESLNSAPDQLVTYFFWAEDTGPNGQPRRTSGDMFFAEVRHFEEIFRQGEEPPGGAEEQQEQQDQENPQGAGNAEAAEKLAELQKEIINATWKLIRRETAEQPSAQFADDSKLLQQSQESALQQAEQLAEKLEDPQSTEGIQQATSAMRSAIEHLTKATDEKSVSEHRQALTPEQAAYQALLKLRAREFRVSRSNSRQGRQSARSSSSGRPSQRQLEQLELSSDENRYETQSTARAQREDQSARSEEQRETQQVLNRLRDLARRQTDLSERLRELQSALEAAENQEEKEEIQRQLKRLREQQQEILRDTDELQQRMEREGNRDRMAEAREQVEQSRENIRQASEALEEGRLSQALTESTRAGRQLNEVSEELRQQASSQFTEEMTQLREQARQLDEDQQKISQQVDDLNRSQQQSLRDSGERDQLEQGLRQQRDRLGRMLDSMQQTVERAEQTEPLLAQSLYDTVQKANQRRIDDALNLAEQLVDAGITQDASEVSRQAGQGIRQVREGVERAAESILGSETDALRRAQRELDDLADQLNREMDQASGRPAGAPQAGQSQNASRSPGAAQPGSPEGDEKAAADEQQQQAGNSESPDPSGEGQNQERQQGVPGERGQPGQSGQAGQQAASPSQTGQQGQGGQPGQSGADQPNQPESSGQGGQPSQRSGQQGQPGQNGQPSQQGQPGQQPGQQAGQQPGQDEGRGSSGQRAEGQQAEGQQASSGGAGRGQTNQDALPMPDGQAPDGQPTDPTGSPGGRGGNQQSGLERFLEVAGVGPGGPITGEGFRQWSDRMRDVEELLQDPELRAEASRIRERVRAQREEFRRHSQPPDWKQLQDLVAEPMNELRKRIADEVRRREAPESLAPIDRDPVPPRFSEGVRRYYERLGSGQ